MSDFIEETVKELEARFDGQHSIRYLTPLIQIWLRDKLQEAEARGEEIAKGASEADIRCARCGNLFENHHWIFSHRGEHYHTGCLEKTPVKVSKMAQDSYKEGAQAMKEAAMACVLEVPMHPNGYKNELLVRPSEVIHAINSLPDNRTV